MQLTGDDNSSCPARQRLGKPCNSVLTPDASGAWRPFTDGDSAVVQKKAEQYSIDDWRNDEDLVQLRVLATEEFKVDFHRGITHYLAGEWDKAREVLEKCTLAKNLEGIWWLFLL